ncbi:MAG: K(+)-transporting ATPase subunit C [Deltaproteobacteria bacterium]|nr:K(+)-transporting ATPase subunit C [Candidatus Deferrimicrobiaceae bacterium]
MKELIAEFRASITITLLLVVLCCGIYPAVVWGIAQTTFPAHANGSLVHVDGRTVGSSLIAQRFSGAAYFHPRPSAAGQGYDAASSGGTNLGPISGKLIGDVQSRVAAYRTENGLPADARLPADAVMSSASGLDPHISVRNAELQASRVATARGMSKEEVLSKVRARTEGRDLWVLGERRVNVLMLNLDLDGKL